ncbi:MAG: hypothetical protein IT350_06125 [Deltaproteobacteria bacterium]|nr:hypothetical protein [Deltaproteobacteria bacterium]
MKARNHAILLCVTAIAILTCAKTSAWATSWAASTDELTSPSFLASHSVGVFRGTVVSIDYRTVATPSGGSYAYTIVRFTVTEQYAGSDTGREKIIYVAGGQNGERRQAIAGAPSFNVDDDVVVFEGSSNHWLFGSSFGMHGVFRFIKGETDLIVLNNNGFPVTAINNANISVKEDYRCELSLDRKHCDAWTSADALDTKTTKELEPMLVNATDFENDIRDIAKNTALAPSRPLSGTEFVEFLKHFVAN